MSDIVCPSKEAYDSVLRESYKLWSSYLDADDSEPLPFHCIELKNILSQTPSFLAHGIRPANKCLSFECVEKGTPPGPYALFVKGKSKWETSTGVCDLEPKITPHQLLLATQTPLKVEFADHTPFTEWPNVQGLYGHDEGNYLTVLLLAWAYILSVRWAELLDRSPDRRCTVEYRMHGMVEKSHGKYDVEVPIGDDIEEGEARWWQAILLGDKGWKITTDYKDKTYISPWSVSILNGTLSHARPILFNNNYAPPSSETALKYLARFCAYHRLYGQCSAALAATLYIPLLGGRLATLPVPKPATISTTQIQHPATFVPPRTGPSHMELVAEYGRLLTGYMTLSSDVWGMRSLLCSTFFNADIECNLVSAWLNPAFAVIDPILRNGDMHKLAALLGRRQPRLATLWLGAIIMGIVKSELQDVKNGLTALDLHAAAWTGTRQSFITSNPGASDGQMIRREDECRLLFIASSNEHARAPTTPWKPFGKSRLCETELEVQKHALCNCHCFRYKAWYWCLTNGEELQDLGLGQAMSDETQLNIENACGSPTIQYCYSSSQSLSEGATRGIFEWLRMTGYPAREKTLYQHPWIDIESSDEEDLDSTASDREQFADSSTKSIQNWIEAIDTAPE
ncbi:hypothetical protein Aspvir_002383 [Aspergillus viridinutans]|uniref:Uncharacterized protein n=1 Tax=Aspergillus viridinutans TaxID=75553 RepID=A0A9P3F9K9_ASPVI|nr:uncharacterized protein Aspvir_002383 [Aspergillus viridinutans]GIK06733.1 hypothetical protein Aspvir_002383 [Aspergillus viridinutans]